MVFLLSASSVWVVWAKASSELVAVGVYHHHLTANTFSLERRETKTTKKQPLG